MATIIQVKIPPEEFALAETLTTCPPATIDCEQFVETSADTVMPLVWVRDTRPESFEAALDQDDTVASYTCLVATETELLYEMDWNANIQLVVQILTMEGAVILDATGSADGWQLRVLFSDREAVQTTTDFCETRHLTLTIHSIRELTDEDAPHGSIRAGLTADQHEALTTAYKQGYFSVPRTVELQAVADEIGVSHQALSERLRRGHENLIRQTLVHGSDNARPSQPHR